MEVKETVAATHLQWLLAIEFVLAQRRPCRMGCRAPLPFFRKPSSRDRSNWGIKPRRCPNGCDSELLAASAILKRAFDVTLPDCSLPEVNRLNAAGA
jgi:hypothetical protein